MDFGLSLEMEKWIKERYKVSGARRDAEKVMKENTLPCPLCQRRTDILFPSGDLMLCERCASKVINQSDVPYSIEKVFEISGEKCYNCGETFYVGYKVKTMICNRCTENIGKRASEIQEFHRRQREWGIRKLP